MKSVMLVGKRTVEIRDIPPPLLKSGEALIRVDCVGVCGADIRWWKSPGDNAILPSVLGHEFAGEIVDLKGAGDRFTVGDRVTADPLLACGKCSYCFQEKTNLCDSLRLLGLNGIPGVFCEYVAMPLHRLYRISPGVSEGNSVLGEPLASSVHLMNAIPSDLPKDTAIAIFGAGLQGFFCQKLACVNGWGNVAMVDVDDDRLRIASEHGASLIVNSLKEEPVEILRRWAGGVGVGVGIDASRSGLARNQLIRSMKKGGTIILLGMNDPIDEADFGRVVTKELRLQGSFGYHPKDFAKAVQYICDGRIEMDRFIRRLPFSKSSDAYDLCSGFNGAYLKTIVCMKNMDSP